MKRSPYDRLINDLTIGGYSKKTIQIYSNIVDKYMSHFERQPKSLGADEIRHFMMYLIDEKKASREYIRQVRAALKFFYQVTLRRPVEVSWIPVPRRQKRIPLVLSGTEVEALIQATHKIKYRALFAVMYASGLRISEACRLKTKEIDSKRMVIRVRGKGDKERTTILSTRLLELLRDYYRKVQPKDQWLFANQSKTGHATSSTVRDVFHQAKASAKIKKDVTPHCLRHSFATHLIDTGCDVTVVQALLGHKSLLTTQVYTHVSVEQIARTKSPWDLIGTSAGTILG